MVDYFNKERIEDIMKRILIFLTIIFLKACVVPVTIGNTIESTASQKIRKENSPELISPEIYKVVGDYEDYLVMIATFNPGQSDKMHYHGSLIYYVMNGGTVEVTLKDGTINQASLETGSMNKQEAGTEHMVKNISDKIIKVLVIEEK